MPIEVTFPDLSESTATTLAQNLGRLYSNEIASLAEEEFDGGDFYDALAVDELEEFFSSGDRWKKILNAGIPPSLQPRIQKEGNEICDGSRREYSPVLVAALIEAFRLKTIRQILSDMLAISETASRVINQSKPLSIVFPEKNAPHWPHILEEDAKGRPLSGIWVTTAEPLEHESLLHFVLAGEIHDENGRQFRGVILRYEDGEQTLVYFLNGDPSPYTEFDELMCSSDSQGFCAVFNPKLQELHYFMFYGLEVMTDEADE